MRGSGGHFEGSGGHFGGSGTHFGGSGGHVGGSGGAFGRFSGLGFFVVFDRIFLGRGFLLYFLTGQVHKGRS